MKVLFFDRSGWCILAKRLEQGSFPIPVVPPRVTRQRVDPAVLGLILDGVDLTRAPRRKRCSSTANQHHETSLVGPVRACGQS